MSLIAAVYVDTQSSITSFADGGPQVDACSSRILCKRPGLLHKRLPPNGILSYRDIASFLIWAIY